MRDPKSRGKPVWDPEGEVPGGAFVPRSPASGALGGRSPFGERPERSVSCPVGLASLGGRVALLSFRAFERTDR